MNNVSSAQMLAGLAGVVVIAGVVIYASGTFGFNDGGLEVRNTACEDIASARVAVNNEFEERKVRAREVREAAKETASDEYFAENQRLEAERHACISSALTADPCKEPFEEVDRLYGEIMADFEAGKGFNEAKFNEREQAKKTYNECVEQTHKPDFYTEKQMACDTELAKGQKENQEKRIKAEADADRVYEKAVANAQKALSSKNAILDSIEKKCNEPGAKTSIRVGGLTTSGTGAAIQSGSPACTGIFAGNDPDLQKRIAETEHQLQKAKAAGHADGVFGTTHLQGALDDLKTELAESGRTCKVDADCGSSESVCCSGTTVGRAVCESGMCSAKKTECVDPEICAGKPAMCVAPATGATQQEGVYISRTIPEKGSCSNNLQSLTLVQSTPESARYAIVGNIPGWLNIDKPSGALPGSANVSYTCSVVQAMGPGNYTAQGSITVYNTQNELINTIPFNVSITVTGVAKMIDVIEYGGKQIPVSELHTFTGPECDEEEHWHANNGSATALDGSSTPDSSECGYGKTKDVPVKSVPDMRS
jgi:hypothetical protein